MAEVELATPRSLGADPVTVVVRDGAGQIPGVNSYTPPTGVMQMWAGGTGAVPTGWLLADGSAVSRTTYAALFAVIGTTYGAGNGSTTFNLPNLTGRFPRGGTPNPGGTGGSDTHVHGLTTAAADMRVFTSGSTVWVRNRNSPEGTRTLDRSFTATQAGGEFPSAAGVAITGDTDSGSTLPAYLSVLFIIKA